MVCHRQSGAKRRGEHFFLAPQAECIRIWADRSPSALTSLWGHSLLTLLWPEFGTGMWVRHPLPNLVRRPGHSQPFRSPSPATWFMLASSAFFQGLIYLDLFKGSVTYLYSPHEVSQSIQGNGHFFSQG